MDTFHLNETIVRFARRLKDDGLRINQSHSLKAIEALKEINVLQKEKFYYGLRCIFCTSHEDYKVYDRVFRGFWEDAVPYAGKEIESEEETGDQEMNDAQKKADVEELDVNLSSSDASMNELDDDMLVKEDFQQDLEQAGKMYTYSPDERLMLKEFTSVPIQDLSKSKEYKQLLTILTNSMQKDSLIQGNNDFFLKKTLRKNIKHGAMEFLELYKKGKSKTDKQILLTLIDISGSMEIYIKMYLPLFYQLHRSVGRADTFFFSTSIYPVSKFFNRQYGQTMELLNERLRISSNGTNLGQCLRDFRKYHSSRLSPQLTTILIFSDGWDRGDMEQLNTQMKKLNQEVFQIIWINPLLGSEGYFPETEAFRTVAPYLTHLISLKDIKLFKDTDQAKWRVK
ncbi:VWA domain-containing protein [Domibacillus epiphyticus]|uniref:VWFA domain-containing protein n=1 Tax=Domibacillus epiphyticus TaxID=1714355 RepID=A0A1V2A8I3_9BACI|nr:VWA domain-containing protein [Domibacillus epiphyticus]OMP67267.1 hypothetical protein BTO28_08035 [Domibacillus epiphyticus]